MNWTTQLSQGIQPRLPNGQWLDWANSSRNATLTLTSRSSPLKSWPHCWDASMVIGGRWMTSHWTSYWNQRTKTQSRDSRRVCVPRHCGRLLRAAQNRCKSWKQRYSTGTLVGRLMFHPGGWQNVIAWGGGGQNCFRLLMLNVIAATFYKTFTLTLFLAFNDWSPNDDYPHARQDELS